MLCSWKILCVFYLLSKTTAVYLGLNAMVDLGSKWRYKYQIRRLPDASQNQDNAEVSFAEYIEPHLENTETLPIDKHKTNKNHKLEHTHINKDNDKMDHGIITRHENKNHRNGNHITNKQYRKDVDKSKSEQHNAWTDTNESYDYDKASETLTTTEHAKKIKGTHKPIKRIRDSKPITPRQDILKYKNMVTSKKFKDTQRLRIKNKGSRPPKSKATKNKKQLNGKLVYKHIISATKNKSISKHETAESPYEPVKTKNNFDLEDTHSKLRSKKHSKDSSPVKDPFSFSFSFFDFDKKAEDYARHIRPGNKQEKPEVDDGKVEETTESPETQRASETPGAPNTPGATSEAPKTPEAPDTTTIAEEETEETEATKVPQFTAVITDTPGDEVPTKHTPAATEAVTTIVTGTTVATTTKKQTTVTEPQARETEAETTKMHTAYEPIAYEIKTVTKKIVYHVYKNQSGLYLNTSETVKHFKSIRDMHEYILNISMSIFESARRKANYHQKKEISELEITFKEKMRKYADDTGNYRIKTRLGEQKAILGMIDYSKKLLNDMVAKYSELAEKRALRNDKDIANTFKNEVHSKTLMISQHACRKWEACEKQNGFHKFMTDVITVALKTDDNKLKTAWDAMTEEMKKRNYRSILTHKSSKRIKHAIKSGELLRTSDIRSKLEAAKTVIENRNQPTVVLPSSNMESVNATLAFLDIVDQLDETVPEHGSHKNKMNAILDSVNAWTKNEKDGDIQVITAKMAKFLHKEIERMTFEEQQRFSKNIDVFLKNPINIFA